MCLKEVNLISFCSSLQRLWAAGNSTATSFSNTSQRPVCLCTFRESTYSSSVYHATVCAQYSLWTEEESTGTHFCIGAPLDHQEVISTALWPGCVCSVKNDYFVCIPEAQRRKSREIETKYMQYLILRKAFLIQCYCVQRLNTGVLISKWGKYEFPHCGLIEDFLKDRIIFYLFFI